MVTGNGVKVIVWHLIMPGSPKCIVGKIVTIMLEYSEHWNQMDYYTNMPTCCLIASVHFMQYGLISYNPLKDFLSSGLLNLSVPKTFSATLEIHNNDKYHGRG